MGPISHSDLGTTSVFGYPASILQVDDQLEVAGSTGEEGPYRLRAKWLLVLLPDGRGLNIAIGTYDDPSNDQGAATIDELAEFAETVMSHARLGH